jgi:hypothetical protein
VVCSEPQHAAWPGVVYLYHRAPLLAVEGDLEYGRCLERGSDGGEGEGEDEGRTVRVKLGKGFGDSEGLG